MNNEEKLILELCKKIRNKSEISRLINLSTFDWELFLRIISKHVIAGVVLDRLVKYPLPATQSDRIHSFSLDLAIKISHNNRLFFYEIQRVAKLLNENGIDIILMKGLSISSDKMRMIGDVDMLVREDKTLQSIEILKELDYTYIGSKINHNVKKYEYESIDLQLPWNNQFQLINEKSNVLLEIHTNLFERARVYDENISSLLDNIEIFWEKKTYNVELKCYTFSLEHSLILMCMHNAIKRSPASNMFILRTIMDIDNIVNQKIDWKYLNETTIKLKITPYIYFSLFITRNLLSSNIPSEILSNLYENLTTPERFISNLHIKCVKSLIRSSIIPSKLYKFLTPFILNNRWSDRIKWIFLFPILFPPRWQMAKKFNLTNKSRLLPLTYLLNPFRWLLVIIKSMRNNKK